MERGNTASVPPPVIQAVRRTIDALLPRAEALFAELHEAVASEAPAELLADPALVAEIERSNAAILVHWISEVARDPGGDIAPLRTDDTLHIARDTARRGFEDHTVRYFRVGLDVAARHVLDAAFATVEDLDVLRQTLALLVASSSRYIDRSVDMIREITEEERAAAQHQAAARRLEGVQLVLDGATSDAGWAAARLGFRVDRPLQAVILWADPAHGPEVDALERLAARIAETVSEGRPLIVPASAASVWMWLPAAALNLELIEGMLGSGVGAVRLAAGGSAQGVTGFRASHQQALRTQRLLSAQLPHVRAATHPQLRALELAAHDPQLAREFVVAALGGLADAPSALRHTLRHLAANAFDTSGTAAELGLHRNTVLARLRRAQELLPAAEARDWIQVSLALELSAWLDGDQPTVAGAAA